VKGFIVQKKNSFVLEPLPPFRLDLTVWTLRRRPDNLVDRWGGETYRRILTREGKPFEIAVSQFGNRDQPRLRVVVDSAWQMPNLESQVTSDLKRLLGIQVDLSRFYGFGEKDDLLRVPQSLFCGMKPPRFLTYFETLVNAIACQQLTLTVGIRLLNRLAETGGPVFKTEEGTFYGFPNPQTLANMDVEVLRGLGFSYQKANYLTGLAQAMVTGQFAPEALEVLDDKAAISRLCDLKGVGRWTAEYFLLRGLGRTNIFPGDDVGARNHLQRWFNLPEKLNYDQVANRLTRWKGYGGLVYFHLLLKSLTEKGIIPVGKDIGC
jgi:DNA-3-methyladenine glycosylase II